MNYLTIFYILAIYVGIGAFLEAVKRIHPDNKQYTLFGYYIVSGGILFFLVLEGIISLFEHIGGKIYK